MRDLGGYELVLVNQDDMAYLTVRREGSEVVQKTIRAVHDLVPFRFEDGGASFQGLLSRHEKNAVLFKDGVIVARRGWNPDFRKVTHLAFGSEATWGWRLYSLGWNALVGLLVGLALVFGLFSSLDLRWIAGVALGAGALSYAIEHARDRRLVPLLQARFRTESSE